MQCALTYPFPFAGSSFQYHGSRKDMERIWVSLNPRNERKDVPSGSWVGTGGSRSRLPMSTQSQRKDHSKQYSTYNVSNGTCTHLIGVDEATCSRVRCGTTPRLVAVSAPGVSTTNSFGEFLGKVMRPMLGVKRVVGLRKVEN